MVGIPSTLESDGEDVAWALQTADTLWKRNERVDAIVWLRRAAQAAGDAQDDDRALTLARNAAELAEWIGRNPVAGTTASRPPTASGLALEEVVDELLANADADPDDLTHPEMAFPVPAAPSSVPTAAELHSGMLDPWATQGETTDGEYETLEPENVEDGEDLVTSAPRIVAAQALVADVPDLSAVEAFGDLPDDLRDALAAAASVQTLERGDEVSGFGLALVLEGAMDVSSTQVDAPVARVASGEVLRGRGTVEQVSPVRLVAAADGVRVATWHEGDVARSFASCPWVEDELRAASDQTHALVGVTTGALGERIDPAMRASIVAKLAVRVLSEQEVLLQAGQPMPGLLLLGAGELEVLDSAGARSSRRLRTGEVVFPGEVLRAAGAPSRVQAAYGGALVLACSRVATQELLVTCPPLLELLAESS